MCVNDFSLLSHLIRRTRRSSQRVLRTTSLRAVRVGALLAFVQAAGCATSAHGFRLNPEQEPEQYRVTCKKRFYYCEVQAKELCEGEYSELGRLSNLPEMPLVKDADVSSTGPGEGVGYWQGEITIQCGRTLPNVPLVRNEPNPTAPSSVAVEVAEPRVCVPGATQQCFGPGACKGAQACLASGEGFGPCDCGTGPSTPVAPAEPPSDAQTSPRSVQGAPPLVSTPPNASNPPPPANPPSALAH
jgi:hypothetical protein